MGCKCQSGTVRGPCGQPQKCLARRGSPPHNYGVYEHIRYQRGVVAALVLFGVCVWFCSHHAHEAAARPTKIARPNFEAPRVDVSGIEPAPIAPVSKIEVQRSKFERYVWEAFPAWQREHP